jgi:hypothetical protein
LSTTVDVVLDPRVKLPAAAIAQQQQLEQRLAEQLTKSAQLAAHAQSAIDQLTALATAAGAAALKPQITTLTGHIKDVLAGAPGGKAPTLRDTTDTLSTLYGMAGVDAVPTAVELREAGDAERELAQLTKAWAAIETGELAQLDAALAAAKLAPIRPELTPTTKPANGDEE